ncbi:MAG: PQQ-dependent sugar dehydrogenase, partial [Candidatus Nanopelagicales bacterium]
MRALPLIALPVLLVACSSGTPTIGPTPATPTAPPPAVTVAAEDMARFTSPWGLAGLSKGEALVSERDTGRILEVRDGQDPVEFARVPEAAPDGEGGLLGIAVSPDEQWVYAYVTTQTDNRVIRMALDDPDGAREDIVIGIPKAGIHNGGRIAFGPEGEVWLGGWHTGLSRFQPRSGEPNAPEVTVQTEEGWWAYEPSLRLFRVGPDAGVAPAGSVSHLALVPHG